MVGSAHPTRYFTGIVMSDTNSGPRNIDALVEIAAPVEAVWNALTDAEELTRWFPLEARVKPGAGGSVWMAWRDQFQFETPIEIWEPQRQLRLVYCEATPPPKPGEEAANFVIPYRVAVDYFLEARGGSTIVRLVHSGFARDAAWDDQYDGTVRGWAFQLDGLKTYLERFAGMTRDVVFVRRMIPTLTREEAWRRLTGDGGIFAVSGTECRVSLSGEVFDCAVKSESPPKELWIAPRASGMATLRPSLDDSFGRRDVTVFLSTFGLGAARVDSLRERVSAEMVRVLPESVEADGACVP